MYTIIWGSGDAEENGLFWQEKNGLCRYIASAWALRQVRLDYIRMMHWSQAALANAARKVEKYFA